MAFAAATIPCRSSIPSRFIPPQIGAEDLARFNKISWVKGQLPNKDGFKIDTVQLFLKGEKMVPFSDAVKVIYSDSRYSDTGDLMYPVGKLLVVAQPKSDRFEFYIQIEYGSLTMSARSHREDLNGYRIIQTESFSESTGVSTDDYVYVVPTGDNRIFILEGPNGSRREVILRCKPHDSDNPATIPQNPQIQPDD